MLKYCQIFTEDMGDHMMKIKFRYSNNNFTIVFCIGRYFSVEEGGEVTVEDTVDGMVITPATTGEAVMIICSFEGQQLRVSFQFGGLNALDIFADMILE